MQLRFTAIILQIIDLIFLIICAFIWKRIAEGCGLLCCLMFIAVISCLHELEAVMYKNSLLTARAVQNVMMPLSD